MCIDLQESAHFCKSVLLQNSGLFLKLCPIAEDDDKRHFRVLNAVPARACLAGLGIDYDAISKEESATLIGILQKSKKLEIRQGSQPCKKHPLRSCKRARSQWVLSCHSVYESQPMPRAQLQWLRGILFFYGIRASARLSF